MSTKASRDNLRAAEHVQNLVNKYRPDVVVTQDPRSARNKGDHSIVIIEAMARTAAVNDLLHVAAPRERAFGNKYVEAEILAERYPEIAAWMPQKRRAFDNEPRNTVLFEALALAEVILDRKLS